MSNHKRIEQGAKKMAAEVLFRLGNKGGLSNETAKVYGDAAIAWPSCVPSCAYRDGSFDSASASGAA